MGLKCYMTTYKTFEGGCSLKKDAIKFFEWHPTSVQN
jgi:hypothetical protein